jgi:hypothetical protein
MATLIGTLWRESLPTQEQVLIWRGNPQSAGTIGGLLGVRDAEQEFLRRD